MWPELLERTDCSSPACSILAMRRPVRMMPRGVLTDVGSTVLPAGGHRAHS